MPLGCGLRSSLYTADVLKTGVLLAQVCLRAGDLPFWLVASTRSSLRCTFRPKFRVDVILYVCTSSENATNKDQRCALITELFHHLGLKTYSVLETVFSKPSTEMQSMLLPVCNYHSAVRTSGALSILPACYSSLLSFDSCREALSFFLDNGVYHYFWFSVWCFSLSRL